MSNIGAFISDHKGKKIYQIIYFFPIAILFIAAFLIGKVLFHIPSQDSNTYWILLGIDILLIFILILFMRKSKPAYHFELYENGVKIQFKNPKKNPDVILFSEIENCWQYSFPITVKSPNILIFNKKNEKYYVINSKYVGVKSFIKFFLERYTEVQAPLKFSELEKGQRLTFLVLPSETEQTILAENALLPFIQNATLEKISLDRFALFTGEKATDINDIGVVKINPENDYISVFLLSGELIFEKKYNLICNSDIFVRSINDLVGNKESHSK